MITWLKNLNARLRGYRTIIISAVLGLIGVIEQTPWADLIPEPYKRYGLVIVPVIFFLIRFATRSPVGQPHPGDTP